MLKKIDIHLDYVLFQMVSNLRSQISTICSYMQSTTPYGEEYLRAFAKCSDLLEVVSEYEDALQACLEARNKEEGK